MAQMSYFRLFQLLALFAFLPASYFMDVALDQVRKAPITFYSDLMPAEKYHPHIKSLASKFHGEELLMRLKSFAAMLYEKKFAAAVNHDDWQPRLNELCGHHLATFGYAPKVHLFHAAQTAAFGLGKVAVAKELYAENFRVFTGYYRDPKGNNLDQKLPGYVDDIKKESAEFIKSVLEAQEEHGLLVKEHLSVPKGLNRVIKFCIEQLLIREKHLTESIRNVRSQLSNNKEMNFYVVTIAYAMAVKRFMICLCLRRLLIIRGMESEGEKKEALGELAKLIVYRRFTNKLPNELLAMLDPWQPLSPFWLYSHAKLDAIMMDLSRVKYMTKLNESLHKHVLYEAMTYGRIVLALRSVASEPVRSHLPHVIFCEDKYPDSPLLDKARSCLDKGIDVYNKLGSASKLTKKCASNFFETGLSSALEQCFSQPGLERCRPLSFAELAAAMPRAEEMKKKKRALKDDWFEPQQPKDKKAQRPRRPDSVREELPSVSTDGHSEREFSDFAATDGSDGVTTDDYFETPSSSPPDSSSMSTDPNPAADMSVSESPSLSESPLSENSIPRIDFASLLAPKTFNVEYDEDEAKLYMQQFREDLSMYEEQRLMAQYEYDAIRDAARSLAVTPAPTQYNRVEHTVEFFSTNDFLALNPEASQVYHQNMYNGLALLAQSDPSIKLEWVFAPGVVIGQDTFRFLCQVFNLDPGTNLLTFANFVKCFDKLTKQSERSEAKASRTSRPVFRFTHAFKIDGRVCLPPIEEIHREHASSGFNWKRIKAFLMHGGAHPYFFRLIHSKYALVTVG